MSKIKDLKEGLAKDIIKYPHLYRGETWVFDILTLGREYDEREYYCEWVPEGMSNDGETIFRLSNFAML